MSLLVFVKIPCCLNVGDADDRRIRYADASSPTEQPVAVIDEDGVPCKEEILRKKDRAVSNRRERRPGRQSVVGSTVQLGRAGRAVEHPYRAEAPCPRLTGWPTSPEAA